MGLFNKLFGSHSDREVKRITPLVDEIESLRPRMQSLSDAELRALTAEYKERVAGGESLDDLLPEAFATVREAALRVLGMEPYRVQLIGGIDAAGRKGAGYGGNLRAEGGEEQLGGGALT